MPNHIKNRIKLITTPEKVEEIVKVFGTKREAELHRAFDDSIICREKNSKGFSVGWFNEKTGEFTQRDKKVVQGLPEGWEFEVEQAVLVFPDFTKVIPPPDVPAYRDEPSQDKVRNDPNWWYTWNINNWGTKWTGYDFEQEAWNTFTFETAWSGVPKIIERISERFPDVEIEYEFADEDTGRNCGSMTFLNGEVENEYYPDSGTKEAYDLAFKLRPYRKDDYVLVDDNYVYKEEE